MFSADDLIKLFGVKNDDELASLLGRKGGSSVSNWRKNGVPPGIIMKVQNLLNDRGITVAVDELSHAIAQSGNGTIVKDNHIDYHLMGATAANELIEKPDNLGYIKALVLEVLEMPKEKQRKVLKIVLNMEEL